MRNVFLILASVRLLLETAQAQNLITPEQAIQAVRQFMDDPNLALAVHGLRDDGPISTCGVHYELFLQDDPARGELRAESETGR